MVIGMVGGTILAVMRLSKNYVLSGLSWFYIWFFRGTPVYVQILIWGNFGILYPKLFVGLPFTGLAFRGVATSRVIGVFVASILALGLNEAAYAAELVRAGIISVERGQTEAAESLGMSFPQTMRRVILPQAMRVIIPPMGNETISMLKTTALVAVISGRELMTNITIAYSQNFKIMPLLIVACIWYIFLTTLLTIGQHYLERYFGRGFGAKEAESAEKRALKRLQQKGGDVNEPGNLELITPPISWRADVGADLRTTDGQGRAGLEVLRQARRAQGHRPRGEAPGDVRPARPLGRRQVDPAALHQPSREDRRRPPVRGRRAHGLQGEGRRPARDAPRATSPASVRRSAWCSSASTSSRT